MRDKYFAKKVPISWLSLDSDECDVQRMALPDRLASLSYIGGDKFGKRVSMHNQNHNN